MNIGICGHFLGGGGKDRFTRNLIDHLKENEDVNIHILYPRESLDENNITTTELNNDPNRTILKVLYQVQKLNDLKALDLDIIHCPGEIIPPYFWKIDARKIITFGGDGLVCKMPINQRIHLYRGVITPRHLLSLASIRLLKSEVDHFTTVSEMMTENIVNAYRLNQDNITPIHHGYDPSTFRKLPKKTVEQVLSKYNITTPFILHVGNFRKIKNTERILKAFIKWSKISEEDGSLVFVGPKDNSYNDVLKISKKSDVSNRVKFLGHTSGEDLVGLYSGAEVLCQPSYRETFSFPILESLACKTPVITSHNIGVLEEFPQSQLRVDPTNVEDIFGQLHSVVNNKKLQKDLVKNTQSFLSEHRWAHTISNYLDLYRDLCDNYDSE